MINIYKVPGVFIVGFHGPFGVGKTLGLVEQGIKMAHTFNLKLVTSFPINQYWLNKYTDHKGYRRLTWKIIDLDNIEDEIRDCQRFSREFVNNYDYQGLTPILYLFTQRRSVILLDEAGLKMFSRDFKDRDNRIFEQMFQLRKNRSFLFYSCQYLGQIDKQLRDNTHLWIYCKGMQEYSKRKGHHVLISRSVIAYSREQFEMFMRNPEKQNKMIYPLMLSGWRFSHNNLMFNKLIGFLKHLRKALKEAHQKSKGKGLYKLFWEFHYLEDYFKNLKFLSDEDLLFKIYDSFGKIGERKNKGELKRFIEWPKFSETEEPEVTTKTETQKGNFLDSLEDFLKSEPQPTNGKVKGNLW